MDRNDNENTTHTPENLVRTCLMLFLLSGRSSPIFENVSQNNVLEKSRKMKIFHILDIWSKSKTYWQNGQSLCHLICKSRNRGWRDYFVYHIRGLKLFKGRVSKPLQPPEPGHHMYLVDINTAALHGFMISSIKLPLHLFQRFCQRGSIYTSYVVIHFNLYVPVNYSSY